MAGGRVLVVDDHPLTREGLSLAARAALPGAQVVVAGSVDEAAAAVKRAGANFRLILLDLHLPGAHGYSGLMQLQFRAPRVPIVIVTARESPELVEAARALGAAGYLPKSLPLDEIADRLRGVVAGRMCFPAGSAPAQNIAAARARIADLSPAQHAVLMALADGRSNKELGRELNLTEATIKAHLTAVFRKMGVSNRTQALLAMRPLFEARVTDATS